MEGMASGRTAVGVEEGEGGVGGWQEVEPLWGGRMGKGVWIGMQRRGREYGWEPRLSDIAPFLLLSIPLLPHRIAAEPLFHPNPQLPSSVSTPPHSGQTAFPLRLTSPHPTDAV